ncbi:hypothetical protein OS493_009404 [Desmophyllum pertusum]|uniref:TauD/TfdA-like domain-containing protein n=1 Tax=Desmophyllum pertusum TaxID=174260 RepID=A0A9W9Z2C9_9CNID|nr:hypothetical protein OS493_009404 [Desmophyllum pertusum]
MTSRVLTTFWRVSPGFKRPSRALSSITSIFETIPREELVTKFKSRLRDRPFLPGSTGGGFPEFLAEPRDSFPHGVRVHNRNQSSLAELTEKCMEYMEENIAHSPAILFRDLPAKTTEDFITIAKTSQMNRSYIGGTGYRTLLDEESGVATGTDDPPELTAEPHNEMSYIPNFPAKVFFFMLNEAADGCGGETPLVKNTELISKLDPDVLRKFEEKTDPICAIYA